MSAFLVGGGVVIAQDARFFMYEANLTRFLIFLDNVFVFFLGPACLLEPSSCPLTLQSDLFLSFCNPKLPSGSCDLTVCKILQIHTAYRSAGVFL